MKIPKYLEVRKPAGHAYRPAEAHRDVLKEFAEAPGVGLLEAFDTMIQERVAVLCAFDEEGNANPLAIIHNGRMSERLVPCCGVEVKEGQDASGLTPQEWDLLPCFVEKEKD